jgi:hypothetical protein
MGDNLPDFESMSEEEQLRWLESLASRQGANPEEFVTAADMQVDEVDPDTAIVDEPGYVPYSLSSDQAQGTRQEAPPQQAAPPPPQEPATPPAPPVEQPPAAAMPEPAAASDDDPLGGLDPMNWLESLAARQGAKREEFTTGADLHIDEVDPDSVDPSTFGPGYTPSESFSRREEVPEAASEQAAPEYEEPAYPADTTPAGEFEYTDTSAYQQPPAAEPEEPAISAQPVAQAPDTGVSDGEFPSDIDPMAWLESLAARQGANPEEFTTSADLQIDEVDPDSAVIDEPGYTPYSVFGTSSAEAPAEPPPSEPQPAPPTPEPAYQAAMPAEEPGEEDESSLSWLEELASDQGSDVTDFLEELTDDSLPGFDFDYSEEEEQPVADFLEPETSAEAQEEDILADMSDEDIAKAQVAGTLTPQQELEWLKRKASAPSEDEAEELAMASDEPAVEGEIPDWLASQIPQDLAEQEQQPAEEYPPLVDDIVPPPTPTDLPDWLSEEDTGAAAAADLGLPEDFTLEGADTLSFEEEEKEEVVGEEAKSATQEAEALIRGYDPSEDHWADALDAEYTKRVEGIDEAEEEEPEWYAQARVKAQEIKESDIPEPVEAEEAAEPTPDFLSEEAAASGDIPSWLQGVEAGEEVTAEPAEEDSELPEWLRSAATTTAGSDIDDWLRGEQVGIAQEDDMSWLTEETATEATAPPPAPISEPEFAEPPATPPEPARAEVPSPPVSEATAAPPPPAPVQPPEERLPQGEPGDLPPWYTQVTGEPAAAAPQPEPTVQQPVPPPPAPKPQPQQAPAPVASTQPPASQPPAPVPAPTTADFAQYQQRLAENPYDYEARLGLARVLNSQGNINDSVDQYETLIEHSAMLDVIVTDLQQAVHPRARRLLGDVYMRQGRLQEALDTYRHALNQL